MADEIRMTEEDTIAPGASQLEDVLELSLLTAGPSAVPARSFRESRLLVQDGGRFEPRFGGSRR